MSNLIGQLVSSRHYLVLEKTDVMELLEVINSHGKTYIDNKIKVGSCGWADEYSTKWFIHFNASNKQWVGIIDDLNKRGYELLVKDSTNNVYVSNRKS